MTLTANCYLNNEQKTVISIRETDPKINFFLDAEIDGDHTNKSETDQIAMGLMWFSTRYIPEYATQLTNKKVEDVDKAVQDIKQATDGGLAKIDEAVKKAESVAGIINTIVKSVDLTDDARKAIADQYPPYETGKGYIAGNVVNYNDTLYEVVQGHTSQDDWKPDTTASLYKLLINPSTPSGETVVADFKQPTGAHDAYKKGDKVTFNGKVYESLADANVYSPSGYPANWKEVI